MLSVQLLQSLQLQLSCNGLKLNANRLMHGDTKKSSSRYSYFLVNCFVYEVIWDIKVSFLHCLLFWQKKENIRLIHSLKLQISTSDHFVEVMKTEKYVTRISFLCILLPQFQEIPTYILFPFPGPYPIVYSKT